MSTRKTPPGATRTQAYRAAFDQLTRIAAELEEGETDLDRVLPLLAEAQAAYEICRGRIEALRTALGEEPPAPNLLHADERDEMGGAEDTEDAEDDPDDEGDGDRDGNRRNESRKDELEDFF